MNTGRRSSGADLPKVDVVILTWNDAEDAAAAIESAATSTGVAVAVQVIDNASEVPFAAPEVPVDIVVERCATNLGVGGGRNRGASLGEAEFVCFLDSDAVLDSTCLERLTNPLLDDPSIALAAPVFAGQPAEIGAGQAPSPARKLARGVGLTDTYAPMAHGAGGIWDIEFAIGACQLVRRQAFESIAGIDDSARFGPEDLDMCQRLTDEGFRLVQVEQAICHHRARRSSRRWFTRRGLAHAAAVVRHYARRRSTAVRRARHRQPASERAPER